MKKLSSGEALTVPLLAFAMLVLLSFVPWGEVSNHNINDFSLFEDLMTEQIEVHTTELLDPLLLAETEGVDDDEDVTSQEELPVYELPQSEATTVAVPVKAEEPVQASVSTPVVAEAYKPDKVNGVMPIEDYSPDGRGLARFASAIKNRGERTVRIAVIGDSYIEGDILTQDIRRLLQENYGGRGVGYMSMHSDFPGFRRSVVQSDANWKVVDIRKATRDSIKTLSGEYCIGTAGSRSSFKGAKGETEKAWSRSKLLYLAPSSGVIKVTSGGEVQQFEVEASPQVQCITVEGETTEFAVRSDIEGLKVLGAWLEDPSGVSVDCMSLRGNSGVIHRQISASLAHAMSEHVPYDLIVLEYGMNALSSEQKEYSSYGKLMSKVIDRMKEAFPDADILMLGVGDRGRKSGSAVSSMPTAEAMTAAQRDCARKAGVMFWDTREAMGGDGAIVKWRDRGLVNADYIHLNHKGGAVLAEEFVNALKMKVDEY